MLFYVLTKQVCVCYGLGRVWSTHTNQGVLGSLYLKGFRKCCFYILTNQEFVWGRVVWSRELAIEQV